MVLNVKHVQQEPKLVHLQPNHLHVKITSDYQEVYVRHVRLVKEYVKMAKLNVKETYRKIITNVHVHQCMHIETKTVKNVVKIHKNVQVQVYQQNVNQVIY